MTKEQILQAFKERTENIEFLHGVPVSLPVEKKEELEQWLEESLSLFEKAIREETAKAYGGCKICYGKGYSTYRYGISGAEDFGNDGFETPITNHMQYCTCDRGKQRINDTPKELL